MIMGRHWLLRVSVCANLFVLIYFALYSSTSTNPTSTTPIDVSPASSFPNIPLSPSSAQFQHHQAQQPPLPPPSSDNNNDINNSNTNFSPNEIDANDNGNSNNNNNGFSDQNYFLSGHAGGLAKSLVHRNIENVKPQQGGQYGGVDRDFNDPVVVDDPMAGLSGISSDIKQQASVVKDFPSSRETVHGANNNPNLSNDLTHVEDGGELSNNVNNFNKPSVSSSSSAPNNNLNLAYYNEKLMQESRKKFFPCDDTEPLKPHIGQRGPFWVLYNYFPATKTFLCDESVTYTTHADFTFLDNLYPLLSRWQGPISLSMYAPGTDFNETLTRILYLRECLGADSVLIKELVSFHIFFDYKQIPKQRIIHDSSTITINCSAFLPTNPNYINTSELVKFGEHLPTYKKQKKLPYPVNVARNVAREMVTTHHILASDIELYPNPNLIPDFLDMIRRNDSAELQRPNPNKLFVLPIFEVQANVSALPDDKTELVHMLKNKSAIPFHKFVCSDCHRIPKAAEWISARIKVGGLTVFHVGKRKKPFQHWEPIYIGTRFDPMYDERLTWEGRSDKMTQGYILCVLDYEFHILDNAFLVHRPGIKTVKQIPARNPVVAKQNAVIAKIILPELKLLYGTREGCAV